MLMVTVGYVTMVAKQQTNEPAIPRHLFTHAVYAAVVR